MDVTDLITRICQIMDNYCVFLIVWEKNPIWMEKLVYSELLFHPKHKICIILSTLRENVQVPFLYK